MKDSKHQIFTLSIIILFIIILFTIVNAQDKPPVPDYWPKDRPYWEEIVLGNRRLFKINQSNVPSDSTINLFVQPNDSTLFWYGSGDVDGNNLVDLADYEAMNIIQNDMADIDGDGIPSTDIDKRLSE